jgi:hypothetical protein
MRQHRGPALVLAWPADELGSRTPDARLADAGELEPAIDSVFSLDDADAAFTRLADRGKRGKVVLGVTDD